MNLNRRNSPPRQHPHLTINPDRRNFSFQEGPSSVPNFVAPNNFDTLSNVMEMVLDETYIEDSLSKSIFMDSLFRGYNKWCVHVLFRNFTF
jgi:hypothetical protein